MKSKADAPARLLVALAAVMLLSSAAIADVILPLEKHAARLTSGVYGWDYSYDAELTPTNLNLYMTIRLEPQPGVTAGQLADCEALWQSGIDSLYSDKFSLTVNGGPKRPIELFVTFTTTAGTYDHDVLVYPTLARGDMNDWDATWQPVTAAHEVGHMWGLYDEYSGGASDPSGAIIDSGSVMGTGALGNGVARRRHYDTLLTWLGQEAAGNSFTVVQGVPEPLSVTILLMGGAVIFGRRRADRQRRGDAWTR